MVAKTDKTKLASAILNVGASRLTGVEKGATVNGGSEKGDNAPQKPQEATGRAEGLAAGAGGAESPVGAPGASDAAPSADPADSRTDRIAFMCSPKEKKHLKQLALDRDTTASVSSLIREALEAKGFLP